MDLSQIQDKVEDCICKVSFVEDFFSQPLASNETPSFSEQGLVGLGLILQNTLEDLRTIVKELSQRYEIEEVTS